MDPNCTESKDERKRQRRLDANRRSAQKSRYRKLVLLDELQKSVTEMTTVNASLKDENDALKMQLDTLLELYKRGEPFSDELLETIMDSPPSSVDSEKSPSGNVPTLYSQPSSPVTSAVHTEPVSRENLCAPLANAAQIIAPPPVASNSFSTSVPFNISQPPNLPTQRLNEGSFCVPAPAGINYQGNNLLLTANPLARSWPAPPGPGQIPLGAVYQSDLATLPQFRVGDLTNLNARRNDGNTF